MLYCVNYIDFEGDNKRVCLICIIINFIVINKIYNSTTLLLSPSIYINSATLGKI